MMVFNIMISDLSKSYHNIFSLKLGLKLVLVASLMSNITSVFGQPYDAPYDIPKFQDFIDGCKFQAPTSSTAASNSQLKNGYTSSWFYVADVDKMAFNQSGSLQRSELRHETNWNLTQADRSLHSRINIVQQTVDCEQVTVLQIHDDANAGSGPNKPLLRVYKHQTKTPINHLWAAYKTDAGGVNTTHVDLGLAPEGYFNCDVRLVSGRMIIDVDGVEKVNVDVSYWTFPSYWKAGVYLQNNGEATAYFDELLTGNGEVLTTEETEVIKTKVYPNPFKDKVNIKTKSQIQLLELYNMLGKVIYKSTKVSDLESFSSRLQSSVYILKLVDNQNKIFTTKLVKN